MLRNDQLTNILFERITEYSQSDYIRVNARTIHDLLWFNNTYLYKQRDIQPQRLLAALIFSLEKFHKENHYLDNTSRFNFYRYTLNDVITSIIKSKYVVNIPICNKLPTEQCMKHSRPLQKILNKLLSEGLIQSKRKFCNNVGLNYSEIAKNRKNTTKDLLTFLGYCQKQGGWWIQFEDLILCHIHDNLSSYYRIQQRQYISQTEGIFYKAYSA